MQPLFPHSFLFEFLPTTVVFFFVFTVFSQFREGYGHTDCVKFLVSFAGGGGEGAALSLKKRRRKRMGIRSRRHRPWTDERSALSSALLPVLIDGMDKVTFSDAPSPASSTLSSPSSSPPSPHVSALVAEHALLPFPPFPSWHPFRGPDRLGRPPPVGPFWGRTKDW